MGTALVIPHLPGLRISLLPVKFHCPALCMKRKLPAPFLPDIFFCLPHHLRAQLLSPVRFQHRQTPQNPGLLLLLPEQTACGSRLFSVKSHKMHRHLVRPVQFIYKTLLFHKYSGAHPDGALRQSIKSPDLHKNFLLQLV